MNKAIKISYNLYRVPRPKRRMQISADLVLVSCEHKGRLRLAFARGYERQFQGCDTLNRTEAIKMIGFLSDYVNMVKPYKASKLNAFIKTNARKIEKDVNELTGIAIGAE